MAIKKGSKVWLNKEDSPSMIVKHENGTGYWICTWFVGSEIKEHEFSEEQLTEEEPESSTDLIY